MGSNAAEVDVGSVRVRRTVATSILGVLLLGGYLSASSGDIGVLPSEYLINAAVTVVVFWFPAMRVGSLSQLASQWRSLVPWLLAWTLVWDLATAGILGERQLFEEWWLVYPSGLIVFGALLALHGAVVGRIGARRDEG